MTLNEFEIWYRTRYRYTSSGFVTMVMIAADLIGVMISFGIGFFCINTYDMTLINFKSFVTYWPYLPVFILFFQFFHLYPGISLAPAEELRNFTYSSFLSYGGIIFSRYIEDGDWDWISLAFIISFAVSTLVLMRCRAAAHYVCSRFKFSRIPVVVYGGGSMGRQVIDRLLQRKKMGYTPVLILDDDAAAGDEYRGVPVIHDTAAGPEIVKRFGIKVAIVAFTGHSQRELTRLFNYSVAAFRYSVMIPDFFGSTNIWMSIRDFDGILGLAASNRLNMFWNWGFKRFCDIFMVILGGIFIFPFLLIIAVGIKAGSPGPVLFGHTRVGLHGKKIKIYKFRTMVTGAEEKLNAMLASDPKLREEWERGFKLKDDPRITKAGKFLRKFSLDEFPQILNVLKGEMSLVGPRPITEKEVEQYGENFLRIFSAKPGMTGFWQVSGRSDTDYAERISYDAYYLQSWSFWLDLWVLYRTIGVVIRGKGAY